MVNANARPLRVACFGAGWVTTHRHVPAMRAVGGYEVLALVDHHEERARGEALKLDIPRWCAARSPAELPFLDEVDVIDCGTAPFSHYDIAKGALESGKHVITEKPFTMTVPEGAELVALAEQAGLALGIVHNFQFARSVQKLDGWIDRGRLGHPRAIWAAQLSNPKLRLPTWYDELPLGLFYDESPHFLYLIRHLSRGEPKLAGATIVPTTRGEQNTPAQITAQYAGPVPITVSMNFEAPLSEWHIAVVGDDGVGVVDIFRDIAMFLPNDGKHGTATVLRTSLSGTLAHWYEHLTSGPNHLRGRLLYGNDEVYRRFGAAARAGVQPERVSGRDAFAVLTMMHEIIAAQ
jgi:scyllo-inositol 2-dehydrogenase (NADP+)